MSEHPKQWTVSDDATASTPGNVRVSRLRWLRHYPKWPAIWFGSLVVLGVLGYGVHWVFWLGAALSLLMNVLYWRHIREHFESGDVNAAIVVALNPMLIAVSTDVTKGVGAYPVIKIIEKSLPTVCGEPPSVGSRLPVVSLYQGSPESDVPHWVDFDPRPVDCVTGDVDALRRTLDRLTEDDWDALMSGLDRVPRPYRPGLFRIWPHG